MKTRIIRCPDEKFKPYVLKSIEFYGQNLISKRLLDNINLTVKFDSKLTVYAFACIKNYNASGKAREFLIEIHPWIGAKEILKTLAHEMVHIKQFAYNETNDTLSRWKGSPIDSESLDYYLHPWEMEAHSLEIILFSKFVKSEKLWEIFDDINPPDKGIAKRKIRWKKTNEENNTSD